MEGSYTLLKYKGFDEDMYVLERMKQKYYKLYFSAVKEEKNKAV